MMWQVLHELTSNMPYKKFVLKMVIFIKKKKRKRKERRFLFFEREKRGFLIC